MTKALSTGHKRDIFYRMLLHHITGDRELPNDPVAAVEALGVIKEWSRVIVPSDN